MDFFYTGYYTGYKIFRDDSKEAMKFYEKDEEAFGELLENEYIIIEDENHKVVDCYKYKNEVLDRVFYPTIGGDLTGPIKPRNPQQYCAMDLLMSRNTPVKLITGCFGSGKTLLNVVAALQLVQCGEFDKIVFVRNNVQVKDTDPVGILPGEVFQKTLPWVLPFSDHCGGIDGLQMLIEKGQLEVVPLAYLRGRSIKNAIIYSMESENLTKEHIQLLLGRVDEGSELWLDGDLKQRDRITFEKSQGLETMIERLSGNGLFGYVHLVKSERSEVSALADLLD